MVTRVLRNDIDRREFIALLEAREFPMTVSVVKGADRTAQQNRLVHKWFKQIGDDMGEPMHKVKARCKYRFGLPILKRDNIEWVEYWRPFYQPIIQASMKENIAKAFEIIPVTSTFTTRQMTEFMDAVQMEYRSHGIDLVDPEARKYEREMA